MKPPDVSTLLDALRDEEARVEAPSRLQDAVLAAWDDAHSPVESGSSHVESSFSRTGVESGFSRTGMWQRAGAIAAAVTLASTLTLLGGKLRTEMIPAAPAAAAMMLVGEPILAGEPVRVVRMRVPVSTLHALGVRSIAGDLADAIEVDVIVGEDGVARAIRVGM